MHSYHWDDHVRSSRDVGEYWWDAIKYYKNDKGFWKLYSIDYEGFESYTVSTMRDFNVIQ